MPRKYSKSPEAYRDVIPLLEAFVNNPGMVVDCKSVGRAINIRQRAYRYRNVMRDLIRESQGDIPGLPVVTPYDNLIIRFTKRQRDPATDKLRTTSQYLQFDRIEDTPIEVFDADGNLISLNPTTPSTTEYLDITDEE